MAKENFDGIKNLVMLSQIIGKDPAYIQGGGGNISVKLGAKRMAIKASGGLLKNVDLEHGYSIVDYAAICDYLKNTTDDEDSFNQKIKSFVVDTDNRPSMETGFHAQFDKYVVHTHSAFINMLTCAIEGEEILTNLFPHALWVPYETPGRDLILKIRDLLKDYPAPPEIVFLQNHGVIVSGKQAEAVLENHEEINERIKANFALSDLSFASYGDHQDLSFMRQNILFPDQTVYTSTSDEILKTQAGQGTLMSYGFILAMIKDKGLTPRFLSQAQAEILSKMESEKYRQQVLKS